MVLYSTFNCEFQHYYSHYYQVSPLAPTGCLFSSKFRCWHCSTVHPCFSQVIEGSYCLTIDIWPPLSICALFLTPYTSNTTLYVDPHLGKVQLATSCLFSSSVDTSIHRFSFLQLPPFLHQTQSLGLIFLPCSLLVWESWTVSSQVTLFVAIEALYMQSTCFPTKSWG